MMDRSESLPINTLTSTSAFFFITVSNPLNDGFVEGAFLQAVQKCLDARPPKS
jgi:hypothetical protein